eukprot:70352-Chlamydomonas_euryale.AAC.3
MLSGGASSATTPTHPQTSFITWNAAKATNRTFAAAVAAAGIHRDLLSPPRRDAEAKAACARIGGRPARGGSFACVLSGGAPLLGPADPSLGPSVAHERAAAMAMRRHGHARAARPAAPGFAQRRRAARPSTRAQRRRAALRLAPPSTA